VSVLNEVEYDIGGADIDVLQASTGIVA